MIASYHNHTSWSDGASPVMAMVARAGELGLDEVGICDHFTLRPDGSLPHWSMRFTPSTDSQLSITAPASLFDRFFVP